MSLYITVVVWFPLIVSKVVCLHFVFWTVTMSICVSVFCSMFSMQTGFVS